MATHSRRAKALRWTAVVVLVGIGVWPAPAVAAPESITVDSTAEAWYRDTPKAPAEGETEAPAIPALPDPCTLPVGCPAGPVTTDPPLAAAYPAGTLHVEATAGEPTAHAYISPDLTFVPAGSTLLGGELTLPISQQDNGGNYQVADAKIVACLTTKAVTDDVYGGTRKAPKYDCDLATKKAVYDKKADVFTVDLGPFVKLWSTTTTNHGIALVPREKLGQRAAWHVSFNGDETEKGKGASAQILYRLPPAETPAAQPSTSTGGVAPAPTTSGTVPGSPPALGAPAKAPTTAAPPPQAAAEQLAPYTLLNSPWYTYRGVVFLPLAFLVALSLCGRSLTRPLSRLTP